MIRLFRGLWRKRIDWELGPRRRPAGEYVDASEKIEIRLLTILEMVNEWLQFAEAKNAGLVALDALGLAAILTILPSTDVELPYAVAAGLLGSSLFLALSLGVSLWSFLPRSDVGKIVPAAGRRPRATDNLYFYGDICGYRPDQLAAEIARRYDGIRNYDPARHPSHVDLASQIVVNSRITVAKNGNFRVATLIALLALVAPALGVLIAFVTTR